MKLLQLTFILSAFISSILFADYKNTEGFDTSYGIWKDGGKNCARTTTISRDGTHSLRLRYDSASSYTQTENLALNGNKSLEITFFYKTIGYTDGDSFTISVSTDGAQTYSELGKINYSEAAEGQWKKQTVIFSGDLTDSTVIEIVSSAPNGAVYLDPITIDARPAAIKKRHFIFHSWNRKVDGLYYYQAFTGIDYDKVVSYACTVTYGHRKLDARDSNGGCAIDAEDIFDSQSPQGAYIVYMPYSESEADFPDKIDVLVFYRD